MPGKWTNFTNIISRDKKVKKLQIIANLPINAKIELLTILFMLNY
jgi:hypothetical protein